MEIYFQIEYKTHPGQQLLLAGSLPGLGGGNIANAAMMTLPNVDAGLWIYKLESVLPVDFTYRYYVRDTNFMTDIEEWGPDREYHADKPNLNFVFICDQWRSMSDPEYALHSSAFVNSILKTSVRFPAPTFKPSKNDKVVILKFKLPIARIKSGHRLCVAGSAKNLGKWDESKALQLGNPDDPEWSGEVKISLTEFPMYYKYLIRDEEGETVFWEQTTDRVINIPDGKAPEMILANDVKFYFPCNPWRGAGVAIPVFSLRRKDGFGVGEFSDLKLLVDWAVKTGIKIIQVLPVNDTVATHTWKDSYPYAAISVYALHPMYINLSEIGRLDADINQQIIEAQGKYLNSLGRIDYEGVMALKSRFFKLIYDQQERQFLDEPGFQSFFEENKHWLKPYSAFSYLRDLFGTPDFSRWGDYSNPCEELIDLLTDKNAHHFDDIAVHYFIQYHAHLQLLSAANYARSRGIVLKGDIPIGVYRNSVDAWLMPQLYHMECQAGAPPDDFSAKGQNWRFPTYNWDQMAKDHYLWWQNRLKQLSHYFDAFRIDHILGFFRIWEIPGTQAEGLMGYFNPSLPYSREELQNRGLWFDEKRLCQPYIREHFLYERFEDITEFVKSHYLVEYYPGCYDLHPDYNTQRKVEEKLAIEQDTSPDERVRLERITQGLFSLISEVLFIPAPGSENNAFFPRNAFHFTRSYQELDEHSKNILNDIYIDYFYRRNEEFWKGKAMEKLPVLKKATNMLLCGEDLGMVPACVPEVMNDLGILSLEVQRMPKNPKVAFGYPPNYPYLSVATPSSHDTSTIRGWWEENPANSQRFFNEILGNYGTAPEECTPGVVRQIILQHLHSPSMWAIFPIQDLLGTDNNLLFPDARAERINQPGNPNHYWRYRMHLTLEELLSKDEFNALILDMVKNSGRMEIY